MAPKRLTRSQKGKDPMKAPSKKKKTTAQSIIESESEIVSHSTHSIQPRRQENELPPLHWFSNHTTRGTWMDNFSTRPIAFCTPIDPHLINNLLLLPGMKNHFRG